MTLAHRSKCLRLVICLCAACLLCARGEVIASEPYIEVPLSMQSVLQAARDGDAEAAYRIAQALAQGIGANQDFPAAHYWFSVAAAKDHAGALNALGQLYAEGLGVEASIQTAIDYLTRAADLAANAEYHFDLANAYEVADPFVEDAGNLAVEHYSRAIEGGHIGAAANLGKIYLAGLIVEKDYDRALELLSAAAEAGDPKALNNLGLMFVRGSGVDRDNGRAAQLFEAAAAQGLPVAIRNLGEMYANGFGVEQDEKVAHELYRLSAQTGGVGVQALVENQPFFVDPRLVGQRQGQPESSFDSKQALIAGDPISVYVEAMRLIALNEPTTRRQSYELMLTAAEAGLPYAQANLALLYLQGRGAPQDYAFGYLWLNKAVSSGLLAASELRNQLAKRLTREELDIAKELAQLQ
ncbi:MAG: tetratricopeptide repeat protein [Pseudomonadota bacterium]